MSIVGRRRRLPAAPPSPRLGWRQGRPPSRQPPPRDAGRGAATGRRACPARGRRASVRQADRREHDGHSRGPRADRGGVPAALRRPRLPADARRPHQGETCLGSRPGWP